jgi:hypothetical protein
MPAPAAAVAHQAVMDPSDRVDYVTRFQSLLEEGELIASVQLALYPEAVALGFTILEGGDFGPSIINDNSVKTWVEVAAGMRDASQFTGGAKMPIEFTIVTNAVPFRRFQRTMTITVASQ